MPSARAFELDEMKGGIIRKIGRIAPLIIPVTMNAILSSARTVNAMDLRGFWPARKRKSGCLSLAITWWDYAVIAFGSF